MVKISRPDKLTGCIRSLAVRRHQSYCVRPYEAQYPVGTLVLVASQAQLDEFFRAWRLHHPLTPEQLSYTGRTAPVASIGFYHGGDVLYQLEGIPGIWHERCLGALA